VGVILNFAAKTIEGFDGRKYSIRIKDISELDLTFESEDDGATETVMGTIGRVTGDVEIFVLHRVGMTYYSLNCRPTQRMF